DPDQLERGREPDPPGQARAARERDAVERLGRHVHDGLFAEAAVRGGNRLRSGSVYAGLRQVQVRAEQGPRLTRRGRRLVPRRPVGAPTAVYPIVLPLRAYRETSWLRQPNLPSTQAACSSFRSSTRTAR